jgi:NADPH2:quinone reductase
LRQEVSQPFATWGASGDRRESLATNLPGCMEEKAIRFDKYGPPSVLSVVDIERPALRSGEVLVEIKASAINPSDVGNVAAAFQAELPRVPGRDFAGVVVECGGDEWNGKEVWGSGAGLGVKKDGSMPNTVAIPPGLVLL